MGRGVLAVCALRQSGAGCQFSTEIVRGHFVSDETFADLVAAWGNSSMMAMLPSTPQVGPQMSSRTRPSRVREAARGGARRRSLTRRAAAVT